ncbi:hypothetical protein [Actinopolymorpha pittospori]
MLVLGLLLFGVPGVVGTALAECKIGDGGKWECGGGDDGPGGPRGPQGPRGPGGPDHPNPPQRVPYDTYATPACLSNGPPPNDPNAMCGNASLACQAQGQEGIMMRYYIQWEQNGPWELVDTRCSGADDPEDPPAPPPVTAAQVEDWLVDGWLPASNAGVSPGTGSTLIDFPTIFYADGDTTYDAVREVPDGTGRQVHVEGHVTGYVWTWGDGSEQTHTDKPGKPYSESTNDDEYLTHSYAATGGYTVQLAVQWTGTFQVTGETVPVSGGGNFDVTVDRGEDAQVNVVEKTDVLSRK